MNASDPIITIFVAYRAFMQEHTGMSWEQIEKFMEADRGFWRARPEATALVQEFFSRDADEA